MKLICTGLPKTGTTSLAAALRFLGYRVHDYVEHYGYSAVEYANALEGIMPDFTTMYADIDAVCDSPACFFWDEILRCFPDAKVVLQERDNIEVWIKSALKTYELTITTQEQWWTQLGFVITPTGRKWKRLLNLELARMFNNGDAEYLAKLYVDHNARVKALVPRDKLLVWNVKQGWKPLCEFLGVPVPDEPFPRLNVNSNAIADETNKSIAGRRMFKELVLMMSVFTVIIAVMIWYLL